MKIAKEILELVPYKPGKPIEETQRELGLEKVYKLASNENPIGVSTKVEKALHNSLNEIYRYPDPSCYRLRKSVSKYYDVEENRLAFGNGSNEIIDLLIRLFCNPGDKILTGQHAFIAYKICAQVSRVSTIEVPVSSELKFDLNAMYQELEKNANSIPIVFIPNPNNPTGTYLTADELTEFINKTKKFENTLVVVDEAYNEFVRAEDYLDTKSLLDENKNLIIMRTFSKVFGLAGLRVGMMMAHPEWIELYDRIRNPFNVNHLAQEAAIAALDDEEYLQQSQQTNWEGLDYFYKEFEKMGVKYWPSQCNFVLIDLKKSGGEVFQELLREGVIARPVAGYGLPNALRISVGNREENEAAVSALAKVLQS